MIEELSRTWAGCCCWGRTNEHQLGLPCLYFLFSPLKITAHAAPGVKDRMRNSSFFWKSWKQSPCTGLTCCSLSPAPPPRPVPSFWHCMVSGKGRVKQLLLHCFRALGCSGQHVLNHCAVPKLGRCPSHLGNLSCLSCWNGSVGADFESMYCGRQKAAP